MANLKFSQFQEQTDPANVQFVVGYNGTDNVRIDPANLGGGATDLNGLSDCSTADGSSVYVGNVPPGLSGSSLSNTVLGDAAGNSIVSGFRNTLVGRNAGDSISFGDYHVCIGNGAGGSLTTANETVCIGNDAGGNSTASDTVIIGASSGRNAISTGHISIGYGAGFSQTSGTENTFLGFSSAYSVTTGSHNTVVGYEAGYSSLSGDSNTLIGASAGYSGSSNLITGSNNIIIGHDASPSGFAADNEITLGNATNDLLRIPGLGSTDGHVLTYSAASGGIVLAAGGGGSDFTQVYRGSMYANQFSTTSYIYMPFTSSSESTASNQDHAIVAPYDGYVSYIQIKNAASITPTATYIEMDIAKDTGTGNNPSFTSLYSTGNISVTTAMRMEADDTLTSTDATFSAGDLLYFRFKTDGNWQRAVFNMVVVYQP